MIVLSATASGSVKDSINPVFIGIKMSCFLIPCRRSDILMQILRPSLMRRFCQQISIEESTSQNNSCDTIPEIKTSEDTASIIKFVNTASETELCATRHVSSSIARRISAHREEHGAFDSVSDLLRVPGIGKQTLQRICRGVLKPGLEVDVRKRNGSRPDPIGIADSVIESLKDVVAVDIGLKHVSWVHMCRNRSVEEWRVKDIVGITSGKWDPPSYLTMIMKTISEMPRPDLYVLQHKSYSNANKATFPMFLFQRTMESMLYASLNHNIEDTGTLRAISMPHMQIGRHFDLQVRGVRMSGQELVSNLIQDSVERDGGTDLPVRMTEDAANTFHSASKHEREHLSNCLLQAIAFYDLVVKNSF